jgi:hypothetical protein
MRNVRRVVSFLIAGYLLLVLFDRFVIVEMLARRVGVPLFLAIVEVAALIGTGFVVRALFVRRFLPADLDLARELLIGYPIFGTVCFLLGTLNVSSWSMGALLVGGAVGGTYAIVRRYESRPAETGRSTIDPISMIVIAFVVGCAFVAAQAPPTSPDELTHHLAVPWAWVSEHRAIDLPLIPQSYDPLGIESADLPLLSILGQSGGIASHFVHLAAALAAIALLLRLARGNTLAAAAVVATPALALTAGWSMVDFPLVGICAAMALDEETPGPSIAAGLLTSYTFVPFALLLHIRRRPTMALLAAVALGSVFYLRNLLLAGNPVASISVAGHPYLSDYVFNAGFVDQSLGASLLVACTMAAGALGWMLVGAGVVLFFFAPSARVLIPFFAIPAAQSQGGGRVMRALLVIAIAMQLVLMAWFVDRNGYLTYLDTKPVERRPSYATIAALDAALPATSRTLVVGLDETFWFAHRVRGGAGMSRYLEAPSPEALYNRLRGDGITHVAVVETKTSALSPAAQRTLALTLDHFVTSVVPRDKAVLFSLR